MTPHAPGGLDLAEPGIGAIRVSGQPEDPGLRLPFHRHALPQQLRDREFRRLVPVKDRGLNLRGEEREGDAGADVGLRMPGLGRDVGERSAGAQGLCPAMGLGQGALQHRVGRRQPLARKNAGLDPAPAHGKGLRAGQKPGRDGIGAELKRARAAAKAAGVRAIELSEKVEVEDGAVAISTMHFAKGLEFRSVVVMACDDEVIPQSERIESVADDADLEEVYNTERHLLYVACTRARDHLLVTGVTPVSEFVDDFLKGS